VIYLCIDFENIASMAGRKFSPEQLSTVRALLELRWSISAIIQYFKRKGVSISRAYISRIKHQKENEMNLAKKKVRGRKTKIKNRAFRKLETMLQDKNPPTQKFMAKMLGVSPRSIRRYIKKLNMKLVKKPKAHNISAQAVKKRRKRAWPLYRKLKNDKWKRIITTDEAWFYLSDCGGKRNVQYLKKNQTRKDADLVLHQQFPRGIMVCAGISYNGATKAVFLKKGCKINHAY
jgi:lambda repressor-like predicted transcriptional regulator